MDRARIVYERLLRHYGPQGWWPAETPFEVVVGALLMHQTSWRNVEAAIGNLRAAGLLDPQRLASASVARLRRLVRVAGLYRTKPKRLRAICRHLVKAWGGDLSAFLARPTDLVREELLRLPGVGPETADSILLYAGGHPVFVVDAYTMRIGRRIGILGTEDPEEAKRAFAAKLPRRADLYQEYHALLVRHGKELCRPRPRCPECPLRDVCDVGRGRKR